jgi:probable phosphoglycerate mutase
MTELIFTRHGQTEWNVARRMQGQLDSPLTEMGLSQARVLGAYLRDKGITAIYSSSLSRAERTATIIMKETGLPGIELSDSLREINLADLEGKSFARATEEDPVRMNAFGSNPSDFLPGPGGERFDEVQKRALSFVLPLFEAHKGERVLIVTHAVILRLIMAYFEKISIDDYWKLHGFFYPCSISRVAQDNGAFTLLERNSIEYTR